jgi:hypothetical protein
MQCGLLSAKQESPFYAVIAGVLSLNIIDQQNLKRLRSIKSDIGETHSIFCMVALT